MADNKQTLVIDQFGGPLTRVVNGPINSGFAKFDTSFGYDPFTKPGALTFMEQPTSILSLTSTDGPITGLKAKMDSGTEYVYGLTEATAKLYKIQVNNTFTKNPNYDTPSVISTFTDQFPTFYRGCAIEPYGASIAGAYKIYVGGDNGITKVYSDGSVPSFVGAVNSYVATVPRPLVQFLGKLYFGNGNNIGEIDSTETVTTYTKLSPGFPVGFYVRDLDVTPDGNYMQITVANTNQVVLDMTQGGDIPSGTEESYKFFWNGTDTTYTSYETYNGYSLTANVAFSNKNFTTGFDMGGSAIYKSQEKIWTLPKTVSPNYSALFSTGNLMGFGAAEYDNNAGKYKGAVYFYGKYDNESKEGLYRVLRFSSGQGTDVGMIPACIPVTNVWYAQPIYAYAGNVGTVSKLYLTASENKTAAVYYPLYKFNTIPTGSVAALGGVYETQTQLFSKKITVSDVRIYGEPWTANNAFTVDLIGSNNSSIAGASYTFSTSILGTGANATASTIGIGQDYAWYNPTQAPTYALGVKITNLGTNNLTIRKVEVDYSTGGK